MPREPATPSGPQTWVRVLGAVELVVGDRPVSLGHRERALLAILAARAGRPVAVDVLLRVVWADDDVVPSRALKVLQNHISRLRQMIAVPDAIVTEGRAYRLDDSRVVVDWMVAERLADQAASARAVGSRERAQQVTADAALLWRGEAFQELSEQDEFRPDAARLTELSLRLAEDWVDDALAIGQHTEVLARCHSLVVEQPLRERRWAQLILALYRAGRQAEALEAFQRLRRKLGEELGLDPSPALGMLQRQVIAQDGALDPVPVRVSPSKLQTSPGVSRLAQRGAIPADDQLPLVGRGDELALLRSCVAMAADRDRARMVIISGEPGCGKSRLLDELANILADDGVLTALTVADDDVSYRALADVVRHLIATDIEAVARVGHLAPDLNWLVPELGPAPQFIDPGLARGRMFEAVAAVMDQVDKAVPLVLAIDDAHRLGDGVRSFLALLLDRILHRPLVIVLTTRARDWRPESDDGPLRRHARDPETVTVHLSGLDETQLADLLEQTTRRSAVTARQLLRATAGNPLLVRHVLAEGAGGIATQAGTTGAHPLLESVLGPRLQQLSTRARETLQVASVLGGDCRPDLIAPVSDSSLSTVVACLEEAVAAGGMLQHRTGGGFRFDHDLVRQFVERQLNRRQTMRVQQRAADELASRGSHFAAARHALAALDAESTERAIRLAVRGAAEATATLDFEGARDLCRAASLVVSAAIDVTTQVELLIALAHAEIRCGEPEAGESAFRLAAQTARASEPHLLAHVALATEVRARLATASQLRWDLLCEALSVLPSTWDPTRIELTAEWLMEAAMPARMQADLTLATTVVRAADTLGDERLRVKAGHAHHIVTRALGQPLARSRAVELTVLAAGIGDVEAEFEARLRLLVDALTDVDRATMDGEIAKLRAAGSRSADPRTHWRMQLVEATSHRLAADFVEAGQRAGAGLRYGLSHGLPDAEGAFAVQHFLTAFHVGGLAELRVPINALAAQQPHILSWTLGAGLAAHAAGDHAAARAVYGDASARLRSQPSEETWLLNVCLTVELGAVVGDLADTAERLYALLLPYAHKFVVVGGFIGDFGPVDRCLGLLAAARGGPDEALSHLRTAEQVCSAVGAAAWSLRTWVDSVCLGLTPVSGKITAQLRARGLTGTLDRLHPPGR